MQSRAVNNAPSLAEAFSLPPPQETPAETAAPRMVSLDAWRGFVMFLMMAEIMHLADLGTWLTQKGHAWGEWLRFHTSHVAWSGCSLHDMIQPSFSFLVGTALVFSVDSRRRRGQTGWGMWGHAAWRALVLILLGVWLRSLGADRTNWTFEDTLTQIGLGYLFLFGFGFCSRLVQWIAFGVILGGYWLAFALYTPPADVPPGAVGVPPEWAAEATGQRDWQRPGFASHWDLNQNAAWAADRAIMNWFRGGKVHTVSEPEPWKFNDGGYSTLSFIPTLATMLLGLLAGGTLRADWTLRRRFAWLGIAGAGGLLLGWVLHSTGICPLVKRIWTPAWVLWSGGLCCLMLAAFHAVADVWGCRRLFFPLAVIGMNSIAAYLIAHLCVDIVRGSLLTHFGKDVFTFTTPALEGMPHEIPLGAATLLIWWLMLLWMHRRKIFLRV